jgi:hypothetical protein
LPYFLRPMAAARACGFLTFGRRPNSLAKALNRCPLPTLPMLASRCINCAATDSRAAAMTLFIPAQHPYPIGRHFMIVDADGWHRDAQLLNGEVCDLAGKPFGLDNPRKRPVMWRERTADAPATGA